jgi:UDP-GlcNAc:undecaprenyl-phosphate GlcNAc-1-phosphate transferase
MAWRWPLSTELSAAVGFAVGLSVTGVATPLAIAAARRTAFYDHPHDYHQHLAPTPLLGGTAVLAGVLIAAAAVGVGGKLLVLIAGAAGLWVLGTVDDRTPVAPRWRLLAETGAALALVAVGLGWTTSVGPVAGVLLTVLWVVGLVNGFNLVDNLDGACGTVGCVSAGGIGTLAAIRGQATLAGLAFALAGACLAFLHWNLARPAKVFLGDGGSRPIGLLIAGLAMATGRGLGAGDANVLVAGLMVGIVILDTALVSVSRTRRGVTLLTGGRDHLTHRLLLVCRSPRAVAALLATGQTALCAVALGVRGSSGDGIAIVALTAACFGVVVIAVLDTPRWRPVGIATRTPAAAPSSVEPALVRVDRR